MKGTQSGIVIAIDGPDGVGKTTQVNLLVDYLKQKGYAVHQTRSSGGTPIGEELRKASLSSHSRPVLTDFYISLAMGVALAEDLRRRKQRGEVVVMDRSPLALVAYNAYGSEMQRKKMAFTACEDLFLAYGIDALIFLKAPQAVINKRREKRASTDYFETKGSAYHTRVREGYEAGLRFLSQHPEIGSKVFSIDANETIQRVHEALLNKLAVLGL